MASDRRIRRQVRPLALDRGDDRRQAFRRGNAFGDVDIGFGVRLPHQPGAALGEPSLVRPSAGGEAAQDGGKDGAPSHNLTHAAILRGAAFAGKSNTREPAMRAQVLSEPRRPLAAADLQTPRPGPHQVLIAVRACAVCRTDLHVYDGELANPKLPLVLGHEIIGTVVEAGADVDRWMPGDRVGVPWLGWTCGVCEFCRSGRENLCDRARFTGYQVDGGYAELTVADERYCFAIDSRYGDVEAAPLMCAGLIGYRTLRLAGDAALIGIYGFGAAAHIIAQVIRHQGRRLFAFTRPADSEAQNFARSLGAEWAGDFDRGSA